jgi:hypothetical protein
MEKEKDLKSIKKAVWTLVIFIIVMGVMWSIRTTNQQNQENYAKSPDSYENITKQNSLNDTLSKCINNARNILTNAEWNYCKSAGNTDDYCVYHVTDLSLGKYGDISRDKERACYSEYPGGVYQ